MAAGRANIRSIPTLVKLLPPPGRAAVRPPGSLLRGKAGPHSMHLQQRPLHSVPRVREVRRDPPRRRRRLDGRRDRPRRGRQARRRTRRRTRNPSCPRPRTRSPAADAAEKVLYAGHPADPQGIVRPVPPGAAGQRPRAGRFRRRPPGQGGPPGRRAAAGWTGWRGTGRPRRCRHARPGRRPAPRRQGDDPQGRQAREGCRPGQGRGEPLVQGPQGTRDDRERRDPRDAQGAPGQDFTPIADEEIELIKKWIDQGEAGGK